MGGSNEEARSGFKSRKPRMRVIQPREVLRFQIPSPDEYQHIAQDDFPQVSESDSEFESYYVEFSQFEAPSMKSNGPIPQSDSADVDSVCDSCSAHEIEVDYMDEESSGSEHESYELEEEEPCCYSPEPPSPPRPAFYFECRLCVKMAREPVVIPCGHMFCADCLDKWRHFFTDGTQCPVCEAKISDSSIIPLKPSPLYNRDLPNIVPPRSKGTLRC